LLNLLLSKKNSGVEEVPAQTGQKFVPNKDAKLLARFDQWRVEFNTLLSSPD